ncbi:phage tail protein [Falsiroseomonas sp.]|uniref:phage tail protein n=1 Tax=Falsiroseomonas sp. TaxID=2870721 RepID=UPI0035645743
MATLTLSVVGSIVGGAIGGPFGAAIGRGLGALAGSAIDNALFGSGGGQRIEGPRLADLTVTTSTYGAAIPLAYGQRIRMGGNIIWAMPLIETATSKRSGGKGGGRRQTSTTYSYSANFAVAFCEGPVAGIRRIWADGKLFYDATASPPQTLASDIRIYTGTESQAADALIAADVGAANCPAYRGLCYLVFEGLQLADFANRIPQITAEIETGGADLARTLHALASRAGVATTDAASAARPLAGYAVARPTSARAAIEELMLAYSLVGCAVPGGVAVKPRGVAALGGMEAEAFGARAEGDADADRWTMARAEENGLPRELTLTHMDPARDYQPGTVRSTRQDGSGLAKAAYDIAVVLEAAEAKARAEQAHRDLWAARNTVETLTLPPAFATLQPGESLEVVLAGRLRRLNITRATVAPSGLVEIAAAIEQGVTWLPRTASAEPGSLPVQDIPRVVPSTLHLLDLPMLRAEDDDAGFYVAAGGGAGWRAAAILRSGDGVSYEEIAYLDAPAALGTCQTILPSGPWAHFDEASTLDVLLLNPEDELDAIPEAEVLAGGNAALVGDEVIGFRNAVLIAPGTYRLSGLLRGRLGTDDRIGTHGPGERFVLLSGTLGLERIRDGLGPRGMSRSYKAVSLWQEETAVAAAGFANTAASLAPLSPVHVAGSRDDAGDLIITWIRRTRIPSAWADGTDVPLGEAAERYEVDIRNAANTATLRTISSTSPSVTYTAPEQAADFGAPQVSVRVRVQQISDTIGRGAAREAIE